MVPVAAMRMRGRATADLTPLPPPHARGGGAVHSLLEEHGRGGEVRCAAQGPAGTVHEVHARVSVLTPLPPLHSGGEGVPKAGVRRRMPGGGMTEMGRVVPQASMRLVIPGAVGGDT